MYKMEPYYELSGELGYFDTDEEFDDQYYLSEEEELEPEKPAIESYSYIPNEMLKEILMHSDISTFRKLCLSNKKIFGLCDNNMWRLKFKQNNLMVTGNPTNFNEWINLYNDMYADQFIRKYIKVGTISNINLQKMLPDDVLIKILKNIGATKESFYIGNYRTNLYNITIYWLNNYQMPNIIWDDDKSSFVSLVVGDDESFEAFYKRRDNRIIIKIYHHFLTYQQLKKFIHQLFYHNYINEKGQTMDPNADKLVIY